MQETEQNLVFEDMNGKKRVVVPFTAHMLKLDGLESGMCL
jgi:hypothetical protein